ncbi:MAG TPA: flagellar hook-associated protein FlgK [Humisphaera sp.]|jgi:flagellar hook-associated protein 1 FlgK|nr:flagellar hook-associated protein FlgK [Humisphaera sp.]
MSLIGALNIGTSALSVSQAALQVTGNNISNAGNADYTRQTATISTTPDQQIAPGIFMGTGVDLTSIQRQIDQSLEERVRSSDSDNQAATTTQDYLSRVETTLNALGDNNISTQLSQFFTSWSNLANTPQDANLRQVVLQDGQSLGQEFNTERSQLTNVQTDINSRLSTQAKAANDLAQQVAKLNGQIAVAQGGRGQANGLLDQRDAVLKQLAQLVNIKTVPQDNGTVDVYVGSEALVAGTTNQGLSMQIQQTPQGPTPQLVFTANGGNVPATSGELGALLSLRSQVTTVEGQMDDLAHGLIFELNKIHSSGQGLDGISSVTASNAVADPNAALNTAGAALPFTPTNGSFVVHVRQKATGQQTSTLVQVDLDGLNGNDTSLTSLAASLNGINGVSATVTNGKLTIASNSSAVDLSFSQDSSGVLAALGVNTFFTGQNASDIAVSSTLQNQPSLLAAAKNGDPADNQTAIAIAALGTQAVSSLNGASVNDSYQTMVDQVAGQVATANTSVTASKAVQATLSAQHDALSGVSLDEEAVNLIRQQRAFQGAARVISTVDQMMQTLLAMPI